MDADGRAVSVGRPNPHWWRERLHHLASFLEAWTGTRGCRYWLYSLVSQHPLFFPITLLMNRFFFLFLAGVEESGPRITPFPRSASTRFYVSCHRQPRICASFLELFLVPRYSLIIITRFVLFSLPIISSTKLVSEFIQPSIHPHFHVLLFFYSFTPHIILLPTLLYRCFSYFHSSYAMRHFLFPLPFRWEATCAVPTLLSPLESKGRSYLVLLIES